MSRPKMAPQVLNMGLIAVLFVAVSMLFCVQAAAQPAASTAGKQSAESGAPSTTGVRDDYDQMSRDMIKRFSENYRVGPQDSIAIRVKGQPDYSVERVKVSPTGTIYHPLLGDVIIAGMTLQQVKKQLTEDLSEYLLDPEVSVELLEAQSAKVGVIGEVKIPRVLVMAGPMTVFDAIMEAGGFLDTGKKTNVTLLRHNETIRVNVKNILEGKAGPGENPALQAGDTIIVHGNAMKVLPIISSITSFASLLSLIQLGAK